MSRQKAAGVDVGDVEGAEEGGGGRGRKLFTHCSDSQARL